MDGNSQVNSSKYETASDAKGLLVILDITPDVELENERLARELVNRIQRTRKKVSSVGSLLFNVFDDSYLSFSLFSYYLINFLTELIVLYSIV